MYFQKLLKAGVNLTTTVYVDYFNIYAYARLSFEDERVNREQFAELKPKLPLGQVPTLTIDGEVYCQSLAISRYAAKLGGIYPEDPLDALHMDMIVDTVMDLCCAFLDELRKEDKMKLYRLKNAQNSLKKRLHPFECFRKTCL